MTKPELSAWQEPEQKPWEPGEYERKSWDGRNYLGHWDGNAWYMFKGSEFRLYQFRPWRGLAKPPQATP